MDPRRLAVLAFAATTLAASGCGSSSSHKPLSRTALVSKGDAICQQVIAKRAAASYKLTSAGAYRTILQPIGIREQAAADELAKLTPPSTMSHDWNQLVTDARLVGEDTVKAAEYGQAYGNLEGVRPLIADGTAALQEMRRIANQYGFKYCSR